MTGNVAWKLVRKDAWAKSTSARAVTQAGIQTSNTEGHLETTPEGEGGGSWNLEIGTLFAFLLTYF